LGTQIVDPNRILGCSAHRADQHIVGAILDTHQRRLSNGSGFGAYVSDDDDRQSGIAQRVAFGPVRSLVELDLLAHPISRTRDVFRHWLSFMDRIVKSPFYERRYIASAPSLSNAAELSKSCGLVGVLDGRVRGGRGDRAGRSSSERAAPSACVGRRLSAPQIVWNRSTRRAGARGGAAGRQAQMTEDFDNHRRIIDGGDNLQGTAAVGTVFHV